VFIRLRKLHFSLGLTCLLLALLMSLTPTSSVQAQSGTPPPLSPAPNGTAYAGWLSVIHGDPQRNSGEAGHELVFLTDNQGTPVVDLVVEAEAVIDLAGRYVEVIGEPLEIGAQSVGGTSITLLSIREIAPPPGTELGVTAALTGSQPFVNLLCRFPDQAGNLRPLSYYTPLFADTYPGVNHFWQAMSYGNVDLDGTTTIDNWFTLPRARTAYFDANGPILSLLAQDCSAAAEGYVNFLPYVGINIMLNANLGCCAYGGNTVLTLDGQTRNYRMTWLPPWSQVYSTLAHETGHALGLPHSSGPASDPPSELDIYISHWDVMSASWGSCYSYDLTYDDCLPPGTIAYHIDKSGWIPAARKITIMPDNNPLTSTGIEVNLEQLRTLPGSNYVLARVPIGGSSVNFYTVEVRSHNGYDQNIPRLELGSPAINDPYVVIYKVNTAGHLSSNAGDGLIVVDADDPNNPPTMIDYYVNDPGAAWTAGETFRDTQGTPLSEEDDIVIAVNSLNGSGYKVTITNDSTPLENPDAPSDLFISAATGNSVTVGWQDNSFNEDGFRIFRYIGNNTWQPIATVGANVTTYPHTGLSCGAVVYYKVAAYKGSYEAITPNWIMGETTPCVPILTAPTSGTQLSTPPTLEWTLNGAWSSFEIALDTQNPPLAVLTNIIPVSNGMGGYRYVLSSTLPAGTYHWRVRAINSSGIASAWSSTTRNFVMVSAANAAPSRNFYRTATPTLRWSPVTWATAYEVQVNTANSFTPPHSFGTVISPNQLSVTVSPSLPDGVYYMRVCARDAAGTCTWSAIESFVVDAP
jgi:hypothetical protein